MEHQALTFKAINRSPDSFYRHTYPVMRMSKDKMIDLDKTYPGKKIIMVDSCGWFYQQIFPTADIYKIEGIDMCKNVSMSKEKIDCLFDDRTFEKPKFPARIFPNSVLIVDHSTLWKYRTNSQMQEILNDLTQSMQPELVHIRTPLITTNDYRFRDRLQDLASIVPSNYITTEFLFFLNEQEKMWTAKFKKLQNYASSLY